MLAVSFLYAKYISSLTGNTLNIKLKHDREGSESHVWFVTNMGDQGEIATETALKKVAVDVCFDRNRITPK